SHGSTKHFGLVRIGPKRTSLVALHMSAFGGKADIDGAFIGPWSNSILMPTPRQSTLEFHAGGGRVKHRPSSVERRANSSLRSSLAIFADAIGGMNEKSWHLSIRGRFVPRFKRICANWGFHEHKTDDCFCPRALGGRFFLEQGNQSVGGPRIQSNFGTESHYVPRRRCDGDQKSD